MKKQLCPKCGCEMDFALPPGGIDDKRAWQCFDCDRPDPLTSDRLQGWLKGELGPKK